MSLPVSVGFLSKNNNKYLRYISEDKQLHGFLQFSGHELVTPYSKFHVDVAMTGNGSSFVHIRSAYNNKYLVRSSKNHGWINAEADEPNEDQSSWSCTLFEPVAVDNNDPNVIRLRHVQLGRYASLGKSSAPFTSCLFAGSVDDDLDALTVINFEKLFVLPKYITFKGDNGKYLSSSKGQNLQFLSDDIKDATVWYETFINNDGSARVKSDHFAKFWRRANNNKIVLDSDDSTPNPNNLFWPIIVENNVVALRNLANNFYCKRYTDAGLTDYLFTQFATITKEAKVEIEETLASRDINNVVYQITDARIYDVSPVILSSSTAENKDNNPSQVIFKISYTNSSTATWNSSLSRKVFSKVTLDADIPFVAIGSIDISGGSFKGDYDWGETVTNEAQITENYTTTVPGNTRAIVNLVATQASVDIPFNYTQKDTLLKGEEITSTFYDGLFTGSNFYNHEYETEFVPIDN